MGCSGISWDNSKIAFIRPRTNSSAQVHNDVFIVDANGDHWASSTPSTLNLSAPAWAPDASGLLVSSPNGVLSVNLATGTLTQFKSGANNVFGLAMAFDATGQKVVVGTSGIFTYKADGSGQIGAAFATPHNTTAESVAFSPDGPEASAAALRAAGGSGRSGPLHHRRPASDLEAAP